MSARPAPTFTVGRILAATFAVAAVAGLTLAPRSWAWPARSWALDAVALLPTRWADFLLGGDADRALNIAIFVPLGAAIAALLPLRWVPASVGVGFAISCAVEIAQTVIPGRVPDVADIVANTAGALVGTVLVLAVRLIARL